MTTRLRRPLLLLGASILMMQALILSIGMVYAETTMDTEEQKQVEHPSMKNLQKEEQASDARFFFTQARMQGTVEEPIQVTFFSDQEVSEARVFLPEEATLINEQLPAGGSVEQIEQSQEWLVQSKRAQNTFVLPLVFEQAGRYELSVGGATAYLEISEQEDSNVENPTEGIEASDDAQTVQADLEAKENAIEENQMKEQPSQSLDNEYSSNATVTKDNFLQHFDLQGSATYDSETGEVTLTTASNNQVGNVTLKEKLSVNYPFVLTGKANIGSNTNGADGMAFGFHRSENSAVGNSGNGMGIAGLTGGFGFKLDSNFNTTQGAGAARDPAALGGAPFAGYVYHETNGLLTTYMGSDAPAKRTGTLNGAYDDIVIEYLPSEEANIFRINYKGETWERDISDWQGIDTTALSFLISGSTGARNNVHSFIFEQMDYVIGTGEVEVSYRDAATNEEIIPSQLLEIPFKSEAVLNPNSGIDDEPYLLGYDYSHVETDALYFDETNNTIKPEAERRNVTYFFNRAESEVTIHYIDDAGTVISPSDTIIGYVNEELEVTIKEIENYKFLFERDNQLLNTVFTREQQNYWLVYILQGSMPPVDPLDPEIEVNPENKPELPENQGLLSIDFISSFNFGSQPISVHDQIYYAQPQRLLDEDGTVNEMEERPNYIQISDRRSATERNGWQLSVTQTKQFEGLKNQQLTGASITFSNQQLVTAQGGNTPSLQTANPLTLVPGNKRALIRAEDTEGTGTWIYRFGDEHTARESVTLNVPKGSNPEATSYSTTLIWELNAIPDN
ncbi:cell surface protein [Enterococcus sp. PF-2]|uniref:lectin-like domain-containing protein n=1 Tax=unclassified Enterococcus TaxID=2608891 RepID=UPI00111E4775|nr:MULTISPECIES: WxL domain-containing protein [unclassified Enterococcus]MEC5340930.1 WxL domain-containing protein [Enterococcus casseliflavus]TPE00990.1 cell surface protein [Enterococcus sp. PF-3]TPE24542.1 cell surface protein [Enterococcus sp. PF-2]